MRYKKLFTHVESHASAVSLLESRELRYIKAINNNNTENLEQIFNNVLNLWLAQQTNLFMWHSSLWWYIPIPIWFGKAEQYWRYQDEQSLKFWSFTVTWYRVQQSSLFTQHESLWWCTIKLSLVAKGSAVQKMQWKSYFWLYEPLP